MIEEVLDTLNIRSVGNCYRCAGMAHIVRTQVWTTYIYCDDTHIA